MRNPVITLAIDSHRDTSLVSKNVEKGARLTSKLKRVYATRSQSRTFCYNTDSDFKLRNSFVHKPTQIGCVNVPLAISNGEMNLILDFANIIGHTKQNRTNLENEKT
jgi:hypothetical protein